MTRCEIKNAFLIHFLIQELYQMREFPIRFQECILNVEGGGNSLRFFGIQVFHFDDDFDRVSKPNGNERVELVIHGGTEQGCAALFGQLTHNALERIMKAKIKQPICFVKHKHFKLTQVDLAVCLHQERQQSAWRADENMCATGLFQLLNVLWQFFCTSEQMASERRVGGWSEQAQDGEYLLGQLSMGQKGELEYLNSMFVSLSLSPFLSSFFFPLSSFSWFMSIYLVGAIMMAPV